MKVFILAFSSLIAAGAFWFGIKLIKLYLKVKRWDRVPAMVIKKAVVKRSRPSASRAGFKPFIEYSYTYNFKQYTGTKVFLVELLNGERGFLYNAAENFLKKIELKQQIYVNQQNPEEAVIFCEGIYLYVFMLIAGFISILIGLLHFLS